MIRGSTAVGLVMIATMSGALAAVVLPGQVNSNARSENQAATRDRSCWTYQVDSNGNIIPGTLKSVPCRPTGKLEYAPDTVGGGGGWVLRHGQQWVMIHAADDTVGGGGGRGRQAVTATLRTSKAPRGVTMEMEVGEDLARH